MDSSSMDMDWSLMIDHCLFIQNSPLENYSDWGKSIRTKARTAVNDE
jgi:hypothetical protein